MTQDLPSKRPGMSIWPQSERSYAVTAAGYGLFSQEVAADLGRSAMAVEVEAYARLQGVPVRRAPPGLSQPRARDHG